MVPSYNEQAVLPETMNRLDRLLEDLAGAGRISQHSEILVVDDGSKDATWQIVTERAQAPRSRVGGLRLSRNQGHQVALLAGILNAQGDVVISVDADLQDDLGVIPRMLELHAQGIDIVYGVRAKRRTDTLMKRLSAEGYYHLLSAIGVEIVFNHADYRLMSRRAIEALREFRESNLFLRGIIPQLGFTNAIVHYDRNERFAGKSKYPLSKMLALAWQGVTSFSAAPLRMITVLGLTVSIASLGLGVWALWIRFTDPNAVPGWASVVVPLFLLSGVQLLSLGVIGEYLAKIYIEAKGRPRFFVQERAVPVAFASGPRPQSQRNRRSESLPTK